MTMEVLFDIISNPNFNEPQKFIEFKKLIYNFPPNVVYDTLYCEQDLIYKLLDYSVKYNQGKITFFLIHDCKYPIHTISYIYSLIGKFISHQNFITIKILIEYFKINPNEIINETFVTLKHGHIIEENFLINLLKYLLSIGGDLNSCDRYITFRLLEFTRYYPNLLPFLIQNGLPITIRNDPNVYNIRVRHRFTPINMQCSTRDLKAKM
jgi:hypothetical protein